MSLEREYSSEEKVALGIMHLQPNDGDVMVITFPSDVITEQMNKFAMGLRDNIREAGGNNVVILCVKDGEVKADLLPEALLNEAGYYKAVPLDQQN